MQSVLFIALACAVTLAMISLAFRRKYQSERLSRESAEQELERLLKWLDTIQTRTPVMVHAVDDRGCLAAVSDEWLARLNYKRREVIGRPFKAFLTEESLRHHPDAGLPDQDLCKEVPLQLMTGSGVPLDVLCSAIAERGERGDVVRTFAVLSDISECMRSANELQFAKDELETRVQNRTAALNQVYERLVVEMRERKRAEIILRTIAEGVSGMTGTVFFTSLVRYLSKALDMEFALIGKFTEPERGKVQTIAFCAHGQIQENFQYELAGTPCAKVSEQGLCLFPQKVQQLFPEDEMLTEHGVNSYIGTLLNDSAGASIGLLVVMGQSPLSVTGTVTSMLQIFASRVAAELERIKQEEELMQVRNLESLGRMAAGIAHEVNNPLTNASINVQMLRKNLGFLENESPILQRVDAIERNIDRASNIAKELLLFSRDQEIDLEPVNLGIIIEKAFSQITYSLENVGIHQELKMDCEILGNRLKLEGLFINLFNNAIEAMPQGGTLSVTTRIDGGKVITRVQDTGVGIPEQHLPKVFDPFFTTKEVGAGTGLGLSIAYGIVRQHNGTIEVTGTEGGGTTIIVRLPLFERG